MAVPWGGALLPLVGLRPPSPMKLDVFLARSAPGSTLPPPCAAPLRSSGSPSHQATPRRLLNGPWMRIVLSVPWRKCGNSRRFASFPLPPRDQEGAPAVSPSGEFLINAAQQASLALKQRRFETPVWRAIQEGQDATFGQPLLPGLLPPETQRRLSKAIGRPADDAIIPKVVPLSRKGKQDRHERFVYKVECATADAASAALETLELLAHHRLDPVKDRPLIHAATNAALAAMHAHATAHDERMALECRQRGLPLERLALHGEKVKPDIAANRKFGYKDTKSSSGGPTRKAYSYGNGMQRSPPFPQNRRHTPPDSNSAGSDEQSE